jgi:uncharacterized protein (DUF2336 family)
MIQDGDKRRMGDPKHLQELLELARDTSLEARMNLVDVIGDLFSERETVLSERERALMTEILEKLVRDFEMTVRVELSKRLAQEEKVPRALVKTLANDNIDVARPLLMQSTVLRDRELIEIVRNRTRQHQLAIALRRNVSEPVSDALVENGDDDVIRALLENPSAHISEATMAYLVDQARRVDTFQEPLVNRADLGPALARRMYWHVSAALRAKILESHDIAEDELDDALESIAGTMSERDAAETAETASTARMLARRIAAERQIDSTLIIKVLRRGEIPLFEALFGEMCGIEPPRLQHVIYETGGKGLAVVCRALQVDKANFAPMFLLSRKGRGGEQVVDPREVSIVMRFFDDVDPDAARKALKRWQREPEFLDAIEAIEEQRRGRTTRQACPHLE